MRNAGIAALLAGAALSIGAAGAGATITSPAIGATVTASGSLTIRDILIGHSCPSVSLLGRRTATSTVQFTAGAAGACTPVSVTLRSFPWSASLVSTPATFSLSGVSVVVDMPSTPCEYAGSISGTYTSGANSRLTVTGDTVVLTGPPSPLCSANPVVTGVLTTDLTTV